jgi:hypothetical protein
LAEQIDKHMLTEEAIKDQYDLNAEEANTEALATVAEEVTDEFCSNEEFDDSSKGNEKETVVYEL